MRIKELIVYVITVIALFITWVPLRIQMGDGEIILGGYAWIASEKGAEASTFLFISIAFSIAFAGLSLFEFFISRSMERAEAEAGVSQPRPATLPAPTASLRAASNPGMESEEAVEEVEEEGVMEF